MMQKLRSFLGGLRPLLPAGAVSPSAVPVTIGGHPLPASAETLHVLAVGTTGSGKTTLIEEDRKSVV